MQGDESLHKKEEEKKEKVLCEPGGARLQACLFLRSQWAIQMAANQNGCAGQVRLSPLRLTGSTKLVTAGQTENVKRNEVSVLSRFLTERIENLQNTAIKSVYAQVHYRPKLKQKLNIFGNSSYSLWCQNLAAKIHPLSVKP